MRHAGMICAVLLAAGCAEDPVDRDVRVLDTPGDAAARALAAKNLASLKDPRIAPALVRATRAPEPEVRCAAAQALGTHAAADAVPPLLALLATRLPGRDCAIEPLGQLRDVRAIGPLLDEAARGDARAVDALGGMGAPAVGPLLNALRKSTDPAHTEALVRALMQAGGKDLLAPLLSMLAEHDRQAKANAALALGLLGDPQALDELMQAADHGIGTAPLALARLGGDGLEDLFDRLEHEQPFRRSAAAAALGQARDPAVVPLLEGGLGAMSPNVVEGSAQALMQLAGDAKNPLQPAATKALDAAWDRRDLRAIASGAEYYVRRHPDDPALLLEALATLNDERLAAAYLKSSSPTLRDAAAAWVGKNDPGACVPADGDERC